MRAWCVREEMGVCGKSVYVCEKDCMCKREEKGDSMTAREGYGGRQAKVGTQQSLALKANVTSIV